MIISFRQGIVRTANILNGPNWLQKTSLNGTSVDLNVAQEPIVLTFSHYGTNYLYEETTSIQGAWGTSALGTNNGPMAATGQTQYLYWDVALDTGELTRGWTALPPIIAGVEPPNATDDQHWYDTTNFRMRVFRKPGGSAGSWQDKIRLFAARYDMSANLIPYGLGSQVGITGGTWGAGNIILGTNNKPLKQSDGTFATTESDFIIYKTSGENVRFDMALQYRQAVNNIPKFNLVSFLPGNKMKLASSMDMFLFVSGIVLADHHSQDVGQVVSSGVVRTEQWDWSDAVINSPVFCGPSGQVTTAPPTIGVVQQVGFICDKTSIYMQLLPPVRLR
jgi:hypothetical protein